MKRVANRFVRWLNPELPEIREGDESVQKLKELVGKMALPLEETFRLSENPRLCTPVAMVVGQYLRERGYDAAIMLAVYTKLHPLNLREYGIATAVVSAKNAGVVASMPLYDRNLKTITSDPSLDRSDRDDLLSSLYLAEDAFVRVDLSGRGRPSEYYMVHGAYHQFTDPLGGQPPGVVFDRVDAYKLRRKYHLALLSPDVQSRARRDEEYVFADRADPRAGRTLREVRRIVREKYHVFKARMDALEGEA